MKKTKVRIATILHSAFKIARTLYYLPPQQGGDDVRRNQLLTKSFNTPYACVGKTLVFHLWKKCESKEVKYVKSPYMLENNFTEARPIEYQISHQNHRETSTLLGLRSEDRGPGIRWRLTSLWFICEIPFQTVDWKVREKTRRLP